MTKPKQVLIKREEAQLQSGGSEEVYRIEKVLKKKIMNGKPFYFVKWFGYPHSQNTWEPYQHLEHLPEMLAEISNAGLAKRSKKIKKDKSFLEKDSHIPKVSHKKEKSFSSSQSISMSFGNKTKKDKDRKKENQKSIIQKSILNKSLLSQSHRSMQSFQESKVMSGSQIVVKEDSLKGNSIKMQNCQQEVQKTSKQKIKQNSNYQQKSLNFHQSINQQLIAPQVQIQNLTSNFIIPELQEAQQPTNHKEQFIPFYERDFVVFSRSPELRPLQDSLSNSLQWETSQAPYIPPHPQNLNNLIQILSEQKYFPISVEQSKTQLLSIPGMSIRSIEKIVCEVTFFNTYTNATHSSRFLPLETMLIHAPHLTNLKLRQQKEILQNTLSAKRSIK